ncbi:hypothetical protein RI103_38750 (plasmid) [Paraburkholderia sp. FT54]|uniref:hypothetical protein n=1 Tax=Paraburkholderia sp. FT54 TaxID=3074437 RepID=UPI002877B91D|nr:hypothetical protein [Paraburkholderia sp. FT54]WNC95227.1 hypothetical protein RI103_38750 [Paraburkholderia sp. FT54]
MADQRIIDAMRAWMQVDTWHTNHPMDEKRFHQALHEAFTAVGRPLSADDMLDALKELGQQLGRPVNDAQYFIPRIEERVRIAERIGEYLHDIGKL